ncbi:MAG: hypothetical protein Q9177_001289 [Variospora cf. flavescens]
MRAKWRKKRVRRLKRKRRKTRARSKTLHPTSIQPAHGPSAKTLITVVPQFTADFGQEMGHADVRWQGRAEHFEGPRLDNICRDGH